MFLFCWDGISTPDVHRKPCLRAGDKAAIGPPVVRYILEVLLQCRHRVDVIQTEHLLCACVRERDVMDIAAASGPLKNTRFNAIPQTLVRRDAIPLCVFVHTCV